MRTAFQPIVLWLALALGLAGAVQAHEGHDHGAPPAPINATLAPRAEAASAEFEIVAIARGAELEIVLDTFRGNEPVEGAVIEVDSPAGVLKPAARGNGMYAAAAPFLLVPGRYDLAFTVAAGDKADVLTATIEIPRTAAALKPAAAAGAGQGEPIAFPYGPAGIAGAILVAFLAGLASGLASSRRAKVVAAGLAVTVAAALGAQQARAQSVEAATIAQTAAPAVPSAPATPAARDIAQRLADGSILIPKSTQRILAIRTLLTAEETHAGSVELPARIIPDPNASGLVQASVGGRLLPPEGGFKPLGTVVKAGDILAYVRPPLPAADATVQAQQARELDQQISIVARKVERLSALQQVIAKSQLEDAQLELDGLKERRANLERVKREPEPLHAPVDGVIAAANAIAGQMAEPSSIIFQIVDPGRLWVEALAFEPQFLTTEATARLADGRQVALAYLGTGLADRNQAIPVQFQITADANGLRPGQLVTVFARTRQVRKGIALPRSAVLRGANGQAIVYEHAHAERFVQREVRTVGLDGERVLVVSGLDIGKRVVVQGAELLDQIR